MCILFEICEKRPFQRCMGWVGGGGVDDHIFEQMELQSGRCTRQGNARATTESESSSLLPPFSGVLVPLCMLEVFLQININACGQELML